MIPRLLGLSLVAALALTGCASTTETPAPTPSSTASSAPILNPDLTPLTPEVLTAETASAESVRLLDALQALIDPTTVVSSSDENLTVPAEDDVAAYHAVTRTIMLTDTVDALTLAETLSAVLEQSGWVSYDSATQDSIYVSTLVGGTNEVPWFIVVSGDASIAGQSRIAIQLASPDLAA